MNTYTRNSPRSLPGPRRIRPTQVAARPTYVLTREEAATELRISVDGLMNLVSDGAVPSFTIGSRRLFRRTDIEAYVDRAVGRGYTLNLPKTLGEAQLAADQCAREATALGAISRSARDDEQRRYCADAARAFAKLATWFSWNAGEFEEAGAA